MKYVIIIPDGAADEPLESLGGRTPLEAARTPAMDQVAADGLVLRANHTPASLPPGSDIACMSLLGYNPLDYYTGRAPLEAAAQGIELGPYDWAIRCNLVTIEDQIMRSFTAGQISTQEAAALMAAAQEKLGSERIRFYPGVGYRNLVIYRGTAEQPAPFSADTRTTPPHDLTDQPVLDHYPRGPGSDLLNQLMSDSIGVFAEHPVNLARQAAGKLPATNIWLWGLGQAPKLPRFADRFGLQGAMITAVDLLRGLAALLGWRRIHVPGATGYLDTDYAAKGRYAIQALQEVDLVCVHIEAPDEASHEGHLEAKIQALEQIDQHIVGPIYQALQTIGEYRIMILPDHPTPIRLKTHAHGDVPVAMAGSDIQPDQARRYDELTAVQSSLYFPEGWKLMNFFLSRSG
ncbi:MAG: cofactor-independent phosphoglycerate mutase [Thermoguttaceae bacterium]|nr:cofactor-independent phosphoglycerate mutase [Thermoguttaceae bacterium]MDW8039087.1 cofactor-independent phosphoglycerate mutase [Thermoguttaceae bacterium]